MNSYCLLYIKDVRMLRLHWRDLLLIGKSLFAYAIYKKEEGY